MMSLTKKQAAAKNAAVEASIQHSMTLLEQYVNAPMPSDERNEAFKKLIHSLNPEN